MNIAIGSDHGGYKLKEALIVFLKNAKHKVLDVGTFDQESCDYPKFAKSVTKSVLSKKTQIGILICKSGLGMSMVANREKHIRAALCHNAKMVKSSREHNNANILVLGADYVKAGLAKRMCSVFIKTKFSGGRHIRRVKQIEHTC